MRTLHPRNVNQALSLGLRLFLDLAEDTEKRDSRVGPIRTHCRPIATVTTQPIERVLFSPMRNANPFFHLFEALWMLSGRNDLQWLTQFNKRMADYSDDNGVTQPGAYGFRWRQHFGYDQLDELVDMLTADRTTRRAVLAMWDPWGVHQMGEGQYAMRGDLLSARDSRDVPCNTHIYFRVTHEATLDMTVCCRSNDLWWGAHGANAVHFSVLLEYMAARANLHVGTMTQISNDYHFYPAVVGDTDDRLRALAQDTAASDRYTCGVLGGLVNQTRMFFYNTMDLFEKDLPVFMDYADPSVNPIKTPYDNGSRMLEPPKLEHQFLAHVALPMLRAWDAHKTHDYRTALDRAFQIRGEFEGHSSCDWRIASFEWLTRANERYDSGDAS